MKRLVFAAAVASIAGQAAALSCMRPDPVLTFADLAQEPDTAYVVLRGKLTFDAALLPRGDETMPRSPAPVPARFRGNALNRDGFTVPQNRMVTLQPHCAGPWCGHATSGAEMIMFAKVSSDHLIVELDPCGGTMFTPDADTVYALKACINGSCPP